MSRTARRPTQPPHWQHSPHALPAMVSEFTIFHATVGRLEILSSYTMRCARSQCPGVPEGLSCDCNQPEVSS